MNLANNTLHTSRKMKKRKELKSTLKGKTVKESIRDTKKKNALGPDEVPPMHSKHIGPKALGKLTVTINGSLKKAKHSKIWKFDHVIPLYKPGRNIDESKNFRPIALLSPIAKPTEHFFLVIYKIFTLKKHENGSRPERFTTTALNIVTNHGKRP